MKVLFLAATTIFGISFILGRCTIIQYHYYRQYGKLFGAPKKTEDEEKSVTQERETVEKEDAKFLFKFILMMPRLKHIGAFHVGENSAKHDLLGINGAGKTTAFSIITGESFATMGKFYIDDQEIKGVAKIGYCPQFDAYLLDFTGFEVLTMLAALYGYKHPVRKAKFILGVVFMEDHGDKLLRYCSGGQKRKISVGIALLANASLIILDEPTAGVDPRARREIWSLVAHIREVNHRAVILCSHSMEECEALCTRVGIMVKGQMKTIGTTQELKTRFGNCYQMQYVFDARDEKLAERKKELQAQVAQKFPKCELNENCSQGHVCKYTIPKTEQDKWSELWKNCQEIATSNGATDYSITQPTLAQSFLSVANQKTK